MPTPFISELPQPVRDGYTATPGKLKSRALMDDGFYQDKRRWGKQPFQYNFQWRFNWDQLKMFEGWFEHMVLRGDGWFTIEIAGQTLTVRPMATEPNVMFTQGYWTVALLVEQITAAPVIAPRSGVLPVWPVDLPTLEAEGYSYSKSGSWLRSEIEDGLAETRNRFRSKLTTFNGKVNLTLEERNEFWDFYRNATIDGVSWFLMPFENGHGRTLVRAKFGATAPTEMPLGALYSLTMTFETDEAPLLTKNEYIALFPIVNDYVESGYVDDGYVGV